MKRERNRAVRTKEGEETKRKRKKNVFSTRRRYGEMLFVKSRFLPHCSPHYHPGGVYIGWVEMWVANGAIKLTVVGEFI